MDKRILVACYEVPGQGGANTSAYSLFKMMQKDGYDVHYLNIISAEDRDYYKYLYGEKMGNPESLINVNNCVLKNKLFHPSPVHPELGEIVNHIKPDVVLGVHFISALLLKRAAASVPLIFYISNISHERGFLYNKKTDSLEKIMSLIRTDNFNFNIANPREEQAVKSSNFILAHSSTTEILFSNLYPMFNGKIYPDIIWMAEWIYNDALEYSHLSKSFLDREIDVVFIASSWTRPEKNYEFVAEISKSFSDKNIHVVGEIKESLRVSDVNYHGLISDREKLFELLGNSKCIVSTSRFDAAPGVLYEGSALGCNIVTSKNCGNWQICNDELVVDKFSPEGFEDKLKLALDRRYEDNIEYFINSNSYKILLAMLDVVAAQS